MGPKAKPVAKEVVLTREDLLKLMPEEDADELLAAARGEPVATVTMTAEEFERWMVEGPDQPFTPPAKK
jgi:hypothetical protein